MRRPTTRLLDARDLEKLPAFALLGSAAWLLPPEHWRSVANRLADLSNRLFVSRRRAEQGRIPQSLLALMQQGREDALKAFTAGFYEEYMQVLRVYRPGGWRPQFAIHGQEHIDAARARGKGAILWVTDFAYSSLLVKMALAGAGYRIIHLSRPEHGFSRTRLGMRFLNPIQTRAETRYLKKRQSIVPGRPEATLREVMKYLGQNELISITVGNEARQRIRLPLLGGTLEVATGPANLCRTTGAALIPVFLTPRSSDSFALHVEAPIVPAGHLSKAEATKSVVCQYAALLEAYIRRRPGSWRGWSESGNWRPGN